MQELKHSPAFTDVRDRILALDEPDRARLARLFGTMTEAGAPLGDLRAVLRAIAELDDADLERLVGWFSQHVNRWGQTPRATGLAIQPAARERPPSGEAGPD